MRYKKVYDQLYEAGYHKSFGVSHAAGLVKMIETNHSWRTAVLDIGCARGSALKSLSKLGFDVYGIDIADIAIRSCYERGLLNCKVSSCVDIRFDDNYFDIVMSSDVFEHVDKDELELSAKEVYRVMKPGAKFYFKICVKPESDRQDIFYKKVMRRFNKKGGMRQKYERTMNNLHVTVEKKKFWVGLFKRHGFINIEADMAWKVDRSMCQTMGAEPNANALSRLTAGKQEALKQDIRDYKNKKASLDQNSKNLIITGYKK